MRPKKMFESLSLPSGALEHRRKNILVIQKWNWPYPDYLKFLKQAHEFIREHRHLKIYIICNHPHCFTLGRGNERGNKELIDFDEASVSSLKYPLYKIHRGGGLSFHYPGQWIIYPVVAINTDNSLEDVMCELLTQTKSILNEIGLNDILTAKKLMGVWRDRKKLASIGMGVERFVTQHGLALNVNHDQEMFDQLKMVNPCGMSSETYTCVDQFLSEENLLEKFNERYLAKYLSSN